MHCLVVLSDTGIMAVTPFVAKPDPDHYGDGGTEPKRGWVCLNDGAKNQPSVKAWIPVSELVKLEGFPK
jgi:hypothetical protein